MGRDAMNPDLTLVVVTQVVADPSWHWLASKLIRDVTTSVDVVVHDGFVLGRNQGAA